jgi:hypothetical protein
VGNAHPTNIMPYSSFALEEVEYKAITGDFKMDGIKR